MINIDEAPYIYEAQKTITFRTNERTDERTDEHRTDLGDFNFDTSNVRALRATIYFKWINFIGISWRIGPAFLSSRHNKIIEIYFEKVLKLGSPVFSAPRNSKKQVRSAAEKSRFLVLDPQTQQFQLNLLK